MSVSWKGKWEPLLWRARSSGEVLDRAEVLNVFGDDGKHARGNKGRPVDILGSLGGLAQRVPDDTLDSIGKGAGRRDLAVPRKHKGRADQAEDRIEPCRNGRRVETGNGDAARHHNWERRRCRFSERRRDSPVGSEDVPARAARLAIHHTNNLLPPRGRCERQRTSGCALEAREWLTGRATFSPAGGYQHSGEADGEREGAEEGWKDEHSNESAHCRRRVRCPRGEEGYERDKGMAASLAGLR